MTLMLELHSHALLEVTKDGMRPHVSSAKVLTDFANNVQFSKYDSKDMSYAFHNSRQTDFIPDKFQILML